MWAHTNPPGLMNPMVIEDPGDRSPLSIPNVLQSNLLPDSTKPEEISHLNLELVCMNIEVVDDTMRDLDLFSPTPKALQLSPQPLAV